MPSLWVMNIIVLSGRLEVSLLIIRFSVSLSRAEVNSSSRRMLPGRRRALAIAIR